MPHKNATMAIVVTDGGTVVLRRAFADGSSLQQKLRERPGGIYEQVGSAWGDKYRIVAGTGNLQLIDDDGLIRVATRLENTPQPGECR